MSKIFDACFVKCLIMWIFFLSKYRTGVRKGYNTQYCLSKMLKKWKSAFDKGKFFGVLLADLSKDFDCLSYDLLLVKLHGYGFRLSTLKSIQHIVLRKKYFLGYHKDLY